MQALLSCEVQEQAVKRMASTVSKHFLGVMASSPSSRVKKVWVECPCQSCWGEL